MTTIALSLFVLACGWIFYKDWRFTRYAALSNEGHPQYFAAAIASAYLFCLSAAVQAGLSHFSFYRTVVSNALSYLPLFVGDHENAELVRHLAAVAFWSGPLSLFVSWLFNRPLFKSPNLLIAVAKKVGALDNLEALFIKCLDAGLLVAFTMKSSKVYIGVPERTTSFDGERTWVALWPIASGYRDPTGHLEITTPYEPQYARTSEAGVTMSPNYFHVVLPRTEISSAQSFDLPTYRSFPGSRQATAATRTTELVLPADSFQPPSGQLADDERTALTVSEAQVQSDAAQLSCEIVSPDDKYRLTFYWLYVALITASVLALPQSWIAAAIAFLLAIFAQSQAAYAQAQTAI